jgi:hypothetical protein
MRIVCEEFFFVLFWGPLEFGFWVLVWLCCAGVLMVAGMNVALI